MRMLDLFSGIGGFALAASWVWKDELDIVGFCEIEEYAQKVLQKNFPEVPIYQDVQELKGKDFKNIDLITGGFPCQDISIAGKGAGIEGERSGLWSEMCRIISEVRPKYAIIENVPMLIHRGLERVLCDLTKIGYDCEWQIIGADDVGAWHRRKRIWIVAYSNRFRKNKQQSRIRSKSIQSIRKNPNTLRQKISNSSSSRRKIGLSKERYRKERDTKKFINNSNRQRGRKAKHNWTTEPNVGRVANGIPNRVDRLKGLGNAIVPQVAELIMERIKNESN
jgi:DNA (cytosine-5)-methyltransferase 1